MVVRVKVGALAAGRPLAATGCVAFMRVAARLLRWRRGGLRRLRLACQCVAFMWARREYFALRSSAALASLGAYRYLRHEAPRLSGSSLFVLARTEP